MSSDVEWSGETLGTAGRYVVEGALGSGAMASVLRARQQSLGRTVALKVLRPRFREQLMAVRQFIQEGDILAAIHHEGVVGILDRGTHLGSHFLALELIRGRPLSAHLEAPRPPTGWVLGVLSQVARALMAVHERGFVHGDVKASNIMIVEAEATRARLIDFGIASPIGASLPFVSGTPRFTAPERLDGEAPRPANDVFSLGVLCFQCLTSRVPFDGNGFFQIRANQLQSPPPDLRQLNPSVDAETAMLVRRMLSMTPEARPTIAQVSRWLSRLVVDGLHAKTSATEAPAPMLEPTVLSRAATP